MNNNSSNIAEAVKLFSKIPSSRFYAVLGSTVIIACIWKAPEVLAVADKQDSSNCTPATVSLYNPAPNYLMDVNKDDRYKS